MTTKPQTNPDELEITIPTPQATPENPIRLLKDTAAAFETLFSRVDGEAVDGLKHFATVTLKAAQEIRANPALEKEFNALCANTEIKFKVTSDIFIRVSSFIMGKRGQSRKSKLASILRYCDVKKIPPQQLSAWVTTNGGWEAAAAVAARRTRPEDLTKKRISNAKSWAKTAEPIVRFTAKPIIGSTEYNEFGVALVFASSGGGHNADIRFTTSSPVLTKAVLLAFATEMEKKTAEEAKKSDAKNRLAAQQASIAEARQTAP